MLPDVSSALDLWADKVTWHSIAETVVNFKPVETSTVRPISATIQPANMQKINPAIVDFNLIYRTIHTAADIKLRDYIVDTDGIKFKLIDAGNYGSYRTGLMEQVK